MGGVVLVFNLDYHPRATRAFAWFYERDDGTRRIFAVLDEPPVSGPLQAVRAAIVPDQRVERWPGCRASCSSPNSAHTQPKDSSGRKILI